MDILFVLIPLSVLMGLIVLGGLWWAVYRGQFEDLEDEGRRILEDDQLEDDLMKDEQLKDDLMKDEQLKNDQ